MKSKITYLVWLSYVVFPSSAWKNVSMTMTCNRCDVINIMWRKTKMAQKSDREISVPLNLLCVWILLYNTSSHSCFGFLLAHWDFRFAKDLRSVRERYYIPLYYHIIIFIYTGANYISLHWTGHEKKKKLNQKQISGWALTVV